MGTIVLADIIAWLLSLVARGGAKRFLQLATAAGAVLVFLIFLTRIHH